MKTNIISYIRIKISDINFEYYFYLKVGKYSNLKFIDKKFNYIKN